MLLYLFWILFSKGGKENEGMRHGVYEVMEEFKDEDKYIGLTIRQWFILLPVAVFIIFTIWFVVSRGLELLLPLVIIFMALIAIAAIIVAVFELPQNWYLFGNYVTIEKLLIRILAKKLRRNQVIYTKHYNNEYEEW